MQDTGARSLDNSFNKIPVNKIKNLLQICN